MTSFASLLSSISGQPATPQPKPSTAASKPTAGTLSANGARPVANNVAAGVKRKPEDLASTRQMKTVRTAIDVPVPARGQDKQQQSTSKAPVATASASSPIVPYRGTARSAGTSDPARPLQKSVPKSAPKPVGTSAPNAPSTPAISNGDAKPKRGFASILQKAKAAQQVVQAAGTSTIKHKPVEKLTKRDRLRMQEEAKQKVGGKAAKLAMNGRSRSGTPIDQKSVQQKKGSESTYKGTMKKPIVRQESSYKGTMNKAASAGSAKHGSRPGSGRARPNEYADWDDLDDVEDYEGEEEDYDSDGSSDMMDAGFDDMEREEAMALKAARQEDFEALEEEAKHKREKLERKKKLEALSKTAAARKRY